ncbi:nuclease A inhibitor family protein [Floridanema evergladense]|uniref:Nuclease A inhibitor family protein n=1 Tax=Floridaenema evergladense BLCC-F167 TaxID=3153639 RepID=A0ABV4WU00_9CYAN
MKSSNAELFAQLTEVTKDLEFPISCSSNPIHPFIWEVETLGEFNIESLLKTTTPDFSEYSEGGKIMRNGDLEAYWQLVLLQAQKHSPETLQKYQTLINLLKSHLTNLELLKIRTLHDPKDNFHIIVGQSASGEWVGISANIPADNEDCGQMGIYNSEQIFVNQYQPETEATANLVDRLQQLSQHLDFFEPEIFGFYTDKGWTVRVGATRESMIHSLLEAIGFARTFPVCKMFHEEEYYDEEELSDAQVYLALDEFLLANISNLRTYMFGMTVSYVFYIVGQTSSGDWAGVTSLAAWA